MVAAALNAPLQSARHRRRVACPLQVHVGEAPVLAAAVRVQRLRQIDLRHVRVRVAQARQLLLPAQHGRARIAEVRVGQVLGTCEARRCVLQRRTCSPRSQLGRTISA
jgi:hypothetical protein